MCMRSVQQLASCIVFDFFRAISCTTNGQERFRTVSVRKWMSTSVNEELAIGESLGHSREMHVSVYNYGLECVKCK